MRARERKPAWLKDVFPDQSPAHLHAIKCPGCGLYVVEDQDDQYSRWDWGLIEGDDITVAVILGRRLARLAWPYGSRTPRLASTLADIGVHADGRYLASHSCEAPRISSQRIPLPRRRPAVGSPWGAGCDQTETDIETFERIWRLPYARLTRKGQP